MKKRLVLLIAAFAVVFGFLTTAIPLLAASKEKVLHSFNNNGTDGYSTQAPLILDATGNLYGTTPSGGSNCAPLGCGTAFELARGTNDKWTENVLHSFDFSDSIFPVAGLIFDAAGNLYGTTSLNPGDVFQLVPESNGTWTENVLHNFSTNGDGATPLAALIFDAAGNLYGTTSQGGAYSCGDYYGCGTVFKLTPGGTETLLHSFNYRGTAGYDPQVSLILDMAGNLYGTTAYGGAHANGTVFQLVPGSNGAWTENVLLSFQYPQYPAASLILDAAGNLYGTTTEGGVYGYGTVFRLAGTNGKWTEKMLHSFNANGKDGWYPTANLVFDAAGDLYGTTTEGGAYGGGTVFELVPGANGKWTEKVLHGFGNGEDGVEPFAGLVLDSAGNLYGTTYYGGAYGYGTVFEVTP